MNFKLMNKIALSVLFGFIIMLSACKKENDVTITETEEPIELGFKMVVNGTDIETNAVAAYCENDSTEFLIISNKQELLTLPMNSWDFEEGDFTYFTAVENGGSWSYGGQALGEDITGLEGMLTISFSDAVIEIESNDGEIVIGSSAGNLFAIDSMGIPSLIFPYEMDFVAEIIQESNYCE